MTKQKFQMYSFVRVSKEMPQYMKHFENDFEAIVQGTCSELHGGSNIKEYSLYQIENGKIINNMAWYEEDQLTLCEHQDIHKAIEMIEEYRLNS